MKLQKGFTLIELMVVIPAYQDYVTRGRIAEATSELASKRVLMEQWFQDSRSYVGLIGYQQLIKRSASDGWLNGLHYPRSHNWPAPFIPATRPIIG